jgi:hypothetical protein
MIYNVGDVVVVKLLRQKAAVVRVNNDGSVLCVEFFEDVNNRGWLRGINQTVPKDYQSVGADLYWHVNDSMIELFEQSKSNFLIFN